MHGIVGFDGEHNPDFTLLANTDKIHSSASGPKPQHNQARKVLKDTRRHSAQVQNGAASLSRKTSTPKPHRKRHRSDSSSQPSTCTMPRPSRSLLIRSKISALDSLSTFGAKKRACLEQQKTPGRKCFLFLSKRIEVRSFQGVGRGRTSFREHRPYLIARPLLLRPDGTTYCARKVPALRHHYYYHNQIFAFLSPPQVTSSSFLSRLSGRPADCSSSLLGIQKPGGRGKWRIAPSSLVFYLSI
jgi:hypothetical protein